jgi:hypothetical protein
MVTMYGIKTNSTVRTVRSECEQLPSASILDTSHNSHNSQHVICANSENSVFNSNVASVATVASPSTCEIAF